MKTYYIMATRRTKNGKPFKNGKWHHNSTIKTLQQADGMMVTCANGYYMYEVRKGNHYVIEQFQPEDVYNACMRMKERIMENE